MWKCRRSLAILACVAIAALAVPALAHACTIPFRTLKALHLARSDLKKPVVRNVTRAKWALDASWTAVMPELNQNVQVKDRRWYFGVTFPDQQVLAIDAPVPQRDAPTYIQDPEPGAPTCALVEKGPWQPSVIRVKETKTEVRILAAAQRTVGSTEGCKEDYSWERCPLLTMKRIRLKAPIGTRRLIFEKFAPLPEQPPTS